MKSRVCLPFEDWRHRLFPTIPIVEILHMCHRYNVNVSPAHLAEIFNVVRVQFDQPLEKDLYPTSIGPVVRLDQDGERELVPMEWGFLPGWWKPSAKSASRKSFQRKCFNARSETVHEKPTYRTAFKTRRCLIPVLKFDEKDHWFQLENDRPFAFAGLWERWSSDEETVESYTFLTTEPNALIADVGHHRMPVVLGDVTAMNRWLNPDIVEREPLEELFVPQPTVLIE